MFFGITLISNKRLYIIAGPNGAGKTTASMEYLKADLHCMEFVNADNIAYGLSPFQPEKVAIAAGKLMLKRIDELLELQVDFAIETTLSSKQLISTIERAKEKHYEIILLFYWLDSVDLAIRRVENRVANGGHNIPNDIIERRYNRGIINLFQVYKNLVDYWLLIDNSNINPEIIAEGTSQEIKVNIENKWKTIKVKYDKEI